MNDVLHFKRSAGTLDELSYAPCGISLPSFGVTMHIRNKSSTHNAADVTCEACRRWLRETGRLPK